MKLGGFACEIVGNTVAFYMPVVDVAWLFENLLTCIIEFMCWMGQGNRLIIFTVGLAVASGSALCHQVEKHIDLDRKSPQLAVHSRDLFEAVQQILRSDAHGSLGVLGGNTRAAKDLLDNLGIQVFRKAVLVLKMWGLLWQRLLCNLWDWFTNNGIEQMCVFVLLSQGIQRIGWVLRIYRLSQVIRMVASGCYHVLHCQVSLLKKLVRKSTDMWV